MALPINILSGAGNILATFDAREINLSISETSEFAKKITAKFSEFGGALEGVLAIRNSAKADFGVDFFNPDGSYGAMCGNGARCAVYAAREYKIIESKMRSLVFEMANSLYIGHVLDENHFAIYFPFPMEEKYEQSLEIDGKSYPYSFFNVGGAVHSVFALSDISDNQNLDEFDLMDFAPKARYHKDFGERGANVNIYKINSDKTLSYRTYERGVEGETGACGTGALSTALTVLKKSNINPVTLCPPSESLLKVSIDKKNNAIVLSGAVEEITKFEMSEL